ncbi:hypothetical protein [Roseimaritima ulvae]|uniref:Uncharacterized protein n=1 Tax=Roseimaritima ulvae TaxID=980254 RepID=A0A5B9R749_9BACT|nr:hypothetical protein [Roseimaritima ulvae]QEG42253.1 hypothetical protein UC8_42870 [Roseimaritima ulvae]
MNLKHIARCFACTLLLISLTVHAQETETDPTGKKIKKGESQTTPVPAAVTRKKAIFELYHETSTHHKMEIEVIFDPRVYPYKVLDGKISGSICDSPHWKITEGEIGPGLRIKAENTNSTPNCSTDVVIIGSAVQPAGYTGTYMFNVNGSAYGFKHSTLFIGYSNP